MTIPHTSDTVCMHVMGLSRPLNTTKYIHGSIHDQVYMVLQTTTEKH